MAKYIGNPAFKVHAQRGVMKSALRSEYSGSSKRYKIWFDKSVAPHAEEVILGTRVMLPRDVMWSTVTAPWTKDLALKSMIKILGKSLRSQAVVRIAPSAGESRKLVVVSMNKANLDLRRAASLAQESAGNILKEKIKENVSITDHTQDDLDRLGNPYARRHGSIGLHG